MFSVSSLTAEVPLTLYCRRARASGELKTNWVLDVISCHSLACVNQVGKLHWGMGSGSVKDRMNVSRGNPP